MGYGISFGEPAVHLESMCGSSSSGPSTVLQGISNCVHFEEGCGPSLEIPENSIGGACNARTEFDATSFSQEKAGPIMAVVNAVMETDYTAVLKQETGQDQVVSHAEMSCTEIDSAMVALEKYTSIVGNCVHFEEGCGPSSDISENISGGCNALTKFDDTSFSQEKAGPIMEVVNAVMETDYTAVLKEKTGQDQVVNHEEMSCTEIDSAMVALEKYSPVEVLGTVTPGGNEGLLPPLVNGSGISIDNREDVNAYKCVDVTTISKDDASLANAFSSGPSAVRGAGFVLETPGIDRDSSSNACEGVDTTIVLEDKVGLIEGAGLNASGLVLARVDVANTDVSSQTGGTNLSTAELTCNVEMVALANTPKERGRKPESSELIVFTRRNPKRSATHAESDLNIDRLTRISNRSRKSKKDKETFDPTLLVRMIQDPNLNTKKRKPLNRREKVPPWGKFDNLSQIMDLSLEFCQLKQEREAEEKKQKIAPLEKMDRKCKISDQDLKHLKQEGILDQDMDSTLTHEMSSVGHENVRRATNERDTTDPGSSPDSVVYNPLSCEANPVEQQQKRLTRTKKKKKNKGENAKHGGRDGPLTVSGNANQGTLYWFQIDKKGRPFSNGKREEKDQDLSAPEVTRKEMGNMPDLYNGVTIASLSGYSINGTQEPFRYGGFMAQLLPAAKPLVPVEPVASCSVPVPTQAVPVPSNTGSGSIAEQPVHVPVMPGQHLPVHMQSISSSLGPLHMPTNPAAAIERTLQVDAQPEPAQSVSASGKPAPKPRVAWVCCDECGKWRCIPAELADVIDETNCRWTCKDNADKVFADCSIPQEKSNAEINAELELTDASGDEGQSHRGSKIEDAKHMKPLVRDMSPHSTKLAKKALGPAPYTPLKTNFFLHRHRRSQTIDEIMVCNCKPPENGGAGCRSQCLNRMLSIECIKGMCPCGDLCSNQQFQRRNYAKLMSLRCGKKGYGLQLLEDVRAGRFLIEYVGEVLDMATYEARQKEYASIGKKHFYFMTLDGGEVIDACAKGNLGRFINHSCDPNCRTEKWIVNGEVCIGLFAVRDIKKGEELTFDYNYVRVVGAAAKKCFCGAANCRGYIGGDPSSTELVVHEDSDEEDYFEPVTAKEQARKESIHRAATVATLSDNTPKKHPQPGKSQDIFGMSTPVVQRTDSVKVHKLGSKEHLAGCKPDSAVSRLASSLVNGPTDKALAVPANSLQAFGHSQSNIYPENAFQSKIREKSTRHKTDVVLVKPSDSQGTSGSVNGDGLSRAVISAGDPFETAKPENSHEFCESKDADKSANIKDISRPSSFSNIAVSSYSLLELHLSRVNSLGEFKMENIDGLSQPPDTSLLINSVERKPLEQENLQNNSCDTSTNNREADDVSTPVLPDHSMEEQVPVDTDADNLWKSSCVLISSSDGYAQTSLAVPEHLNLPIEDTPSEEDAPRTPVHVTRFLSNRVHSRRSGHKTSSYNEPSVSDVPTEHVDLYLKNPDEHDRSMSPPVGTSGMKNVSTGMAEEDLAMYQEVKEMAHTAACDFEGVEEKLDKLLDEGGSINRRRHATKGYLKLLIVTAAAGDTGTSQRLRDLSLILDALLKTSNSYVLMDIMKTNGLQMLHTILKQNRDDFTRIPIIRKLLKVLGHLADRGILTLEQMNQGPPRPGMESFRESIYKLTKHKDKQVHHNARAFFDKYMPKYMRVHDSFSHTCNPSTSKRKSRWDCPSDSHNQDPSFPSYNSQAQHPERPTKRPCSENMEEDVPPGFEPVGPPPGFETDSPPGFKSVSPPGFGSLLQPALGSGLDIPPVQVALGYRQESYRPGVSVSYGIPAVAAQTLGVFVQSGETVCWGIAPSIPFQPFPPLPPNATIGNNNVGNNGPGLRNDRARRRWNSNSKNQRRFSRPWNNNNCARKNSNGQRSCKDWPKWPRERR